MNERLLQYIWQFQHFNKRELALGNGDTFQVMYPGQFNTGQGPDFLEARIKMGDTIWVGQVELHVKTSDWYKHAHQFDRNYNNVILHVVWDNDMGEIVHNIPVFSMKDRVSKLLLKQYDTWMNSQSFIPCDNQAALVPDIIWVTWKDRLMVERLQRKTATILSYLQQNNQHWEETCWWLLARNFGVKVNAEAFEAIARSLPLVLLAKHRNQVQQLEALLLGQAGLLEGEFEDAYAQQLKKEYAFYKHKYQLQPIRESVNFLRMRPWGFPTVRLAQLAMLLHQCDNLFSRIKEAREAEDIRTLLAVTATDFWNTHYTLHQTSVLRPKKPGMQLTDAIMINTVVPLLFAYGHLHHDDVLKDRALQWLGTVAGEINTITTGFSNLNVVNKNAYDSQALIQLKTAWCDQKKCLDCAIGNALLKKSAPLVML
jgi:Protein of unknown function (DUF2851)